MNQSLIWHVVCGAIVLALPATSVAGIVAPEQDDGVVSAGGDPTGSDHPHACPCGGVGCLLCTQACACGGVGCSMCTPMAGEDSGILSGNFVVGPTTPGKWGEPERGTSATITYSFATGAGYVTGESNAGGTVVPLESFMPFSFAEIKREIRRAFDSWEEVAGLTFVEAPDDGARFSSPFSTSGDIRTGGHAFDGPRGTLAHGYFPPSILGSGASDFHFDVADTWKIGFGGEGYDIFQVAAHEIGHAIGLNHTNVPNSLMNAIYSENFAGPQADDIAGAVLLYGPALVPEPSTFLLGVWGSVLLLGWLRPERDRRRCVAVPK